MAQLSIRAIVQTILRTISLSTNNLERFNDLKRKEKKKKTQRNIIENFVLEIRKYLVHLLAVLTIKARIAG